MSKSVKELAEKFYELGNSGGDLSEVFTDDFIFGIMPGFPYGGDQNGLEASLEFFEKLGKHFDFWEVIPQKYIEIDDTNIAVQGLYRTKATESQQDVELETVHFWTCSNGKLNTYKHYCDTSTLCSALNHSIPH